MPETYPLGVFVRANADLADSLAFLRSLNVSTCHLGIDSGSLPAAGRETELRQLLESYDVEPTVVYCLFEGEDYADIPTVGRTVGLVPRDYRDERLRAAERIAELAREVGAPAIGLHLGFIPSERGSGEYREIVAATRELADFCAGLGLRVHLETGQETADLLLAFLGDLERTNVVVNFDPANMILYGTGDPIEAARKLVNHIRSVHCKDAVWSARPGEEWGLEVPLGQGNVDFLRLLEVLREGGYRGTLTIEREISGEQQRKDIARAVGYLRELLERVFAARAGDA